MEVCASWGFLIQSNPLITNSKVLWKVVVISVVRCMWTCPSKHAKISAFFHPALLQSANNTASERLCLSTLWSDARCVLTSGLNCPCNKSYLPHPAECIVTTKKLKDRKCRRRRKQRSKCFWNTTRRNIYFAMRQASQAEWAGSCAASTEEHSVQMVECHHDSIAAVAAETKCGRAAISR